MSCGLCCPRLVLDLLDTKTPNMQDRLCRAVRTFGWLVTFAVMTVGYSTPMHADSLLPSKTDALGWLFKPSMATLPLVGERELPSSSADSAAQALVQADANEPATAGVTIDGLGLDPLLTWDDDWSKNGAEGIRPFILISILLGAAARFLTSATFYECAADVFGPLNWADKD
jgi:hypothetical protein